MKAVRHIFAAALMMTLLFCGCKTAADDSEALALKIRTDCLAASGCHMDADIRADYGEKIYDFTLSCDFCRGGDSTVSVSAPDLIAGISATVSDSGNELAFDDVSLHTGKLPNTELTPLGALPAMGEAWCSGYISTACTEDYNGVKCLYVNYLVGYGADEVEYRTWFDRATLAPVYGEIVSDDDVVIYVNFK